MSSQINTSSLMNHKRMNKIHPDDTDYLDFQKTFDKILYQGLLKKQRSQKIKKKILACINNWLKGWKQRLGVHSQRRKRIPVELQSLSWISYCSTYF